jgi:hypothetical protein
LQSASTNTDFAISSYADANGTYVSLGANYYLNSSGNDAVFETTDRSAYVLLDARNNGTVSFGTNSSGVAAERMRITSSGEVLVGKTTSGTTSTVGTDIRSNGRIQLTVDGDDGMRINRKNSDGPIQLFQKDGTTVGRIVYSSATNIALGNASKGIGIGTGSVFPTNGSTAISDAGLDLGYSSSRFKDLFLSGGAYIGGTGSANYLDDYEVGTFSPTLDLASNITSAAVDNYDYVKIGNGATNNDWHDVGVVSLVTGSGQNQFGMGVITRGGTSFNQVNVYVQGNQVNATGTISTWLRGTLTYRAG